MEHEIISEILTHIANNNINKITFSNIRNKELELDKVIGKLVTIKESINLQLEYRYKRIIKHSNIVTTDSSSIENSIKELFKLAKDINVVTIDENINIKISKKFKISVNRKKMATKAISFEHNKKKDYFIVYRPQKVRPKNLTFWRSVFLWLNIILNLKRKSY